jgi:hypothetical protein
MRKRDKVLYTASLIGRDLSQSDGRGRPGRGVDPDSAAMDKPFPELTDLHLGIYDIYPAQRF